MVSTRDSFSFLDSFGGPIVVLGDDCQTASKGRGRIDIDHGSFTNVLFFLSLAANIFSTYHMTHTGSPKNVIFTPNDTYISEISTGRIVSIDTADHSSKVYKFSHFVPFSSPSKLLAHAN